MLIGLVPSYAQIGILAPILLIVLRCVQGVAFGGEWAGAALIAVEHAPEKRQGFFGILSADGLPDRAVPVDGNLRLAGQRCPRTTSCHGDGVFPSWEAPCSS